MQIVASSRRVCCPLLVLIALLAFSAACHAVTMRVTLGFDGVQKSGLWTPVAVSLTNKSDENVEGLLVPSVPPEVGIPPLPVCMTPVTLPAHSTKLYHTYIRLYPFGPKLTVSLLPRHFGVLASRDVATQVVDANDKLIVTIGPRAARLSFMQGETIPVQRRQGSYYGPAQPSQATIYAGSLSPRELPDRSAAYEGANVIIASDLSPDTVNPNALKALSMWVAGGGTLVVSAGADYKALTNPFYDELLPVQILGAANLAGMQALGPLGRTTFPAGPAAVTKVAVKPGIGSIVASEPGAPLIVDRRYGAGNVVFLAFDIHASPFKDWDGQTEFWKSIIKNSATEPAISTTTVFAGDQSRGGYYQQDYSATGLAAVAMQNPSIKTPSINTIAFFLLAYLIALVPVNYFVLRRRRRLELAWVSTPAIVILFALGAYAIGYTMKGGELRLCECRFVEGSSGARFARAVSNAFVFSPARRSYDLAAADPTALSQVIPFSRDDGPVDTYLGETTALRDVAIPMWSSKTFEAVGGEDLGGSIQSDLRLQGPMIKGTVTNNTGVDLRDCVVFFGRDRSRGFSLPRGAVRQVEVTLGTGGPVPQPDFYGGGMNLRLRLLKFGDYKAASSAGLTLVGFSTPRRATFDMPDYEPRSEAAACYLFHLKYATGDVVNITPAMVSAVWDDMAPGAPAPGAPGPIKGFLERTVYQGQQVTGTFRLPVPDGLKVTSLRPMGKLTGQGEWFIWNGTTGRWDRLVAPPKDPSIYVTSAAKVKVKFRNPSGSPAPVTVKLSFAAEAKR